MLIGVITCYKSRSIKRSSAEQQKAKNRHEGEGAGNVRNLVHAAEDQVLKIPDDAAGDLSDDEAFDLDKMKRRRAAKRKTAALKYAAGEPLLGAEDEILKREDIII